LVLTQNAEIEKKQLLMTIFDETTSSADCKMLNNGVAHLYP